jgi:hypothetical protein
MRRILGFLLLLALPGCDGLQRSSSSGVEERSETARLEGEDLEPPIPAPEPGMLEKVRASVEPSAPEEVSEGRMPTDTTDASGLVVPRYAPTDSAQGGQAPAENPDRILFPHDFPRPEAIRGIYLNAWSAGSLRRREALANLARRTELNTFVIDIKDASGFLSHDSQVPLAREVGATKDLRIRNLPGLLLFLKENEIYPIARIVVAKDPVLAKGRPDLAIHDSAGGVWLDQDSATWLNLHHREVWDYHVDLAREVVRMGFPEVQWDYVRFPDAPAALLSRTVFPGAGSRTKTEAVRAFLGYARDALGGEGVLVTADVFGVTTSYRRDVGIGQLWESFIDRVDVALPMVYPSHYWTGSFGFERPNAHPYEIVRRALRDGLARSDTIPGAGAVCAWLQDFTLGDPPYGAPEVRAQIQAAYDAGVNDWILWNPGSRYTESALLPADGLPSWMEPVMRVGGRIVTISRRHEVLGEGGNDDEEGVGRAVPDTSRAGGGG